MKIYTWNIAEEIHKAHFKQNFISKISQTRTSPKYGPKFYLITILEKVIYSEIYK